jgi:hypothetical protein
MTAITLRRKYRSIWKRVETLVLDDCLRLFPSPTKLALKSFKKGGKDEQAHPKNQ